MQFTTFLSLKPFRNDVSYVKSGAFLSGGTSGSAYEKSVAPAHGFLIEQGPSSFLDSSTIQSQNVYRNLNMTIYASCPSFQDDTGELQQEEDDQDK